jgi:hypothetical protein
MCYRLGTVFVVREYLRDDGTSPFAAWFMSLDVAISRWEDYRRGRARGER